MTDGMRPATGTGEVLAALRRSLAGDGVTAPLPPGGPEREQTLAMLRPAEPVTEPDAAAVVATSGSTGRPRGVVLTRAALTASAAATHARLGGPGRWLLALPVHYVAGLMVLVRGLVGGGGAVEVDPGLTGLPEPAADQPTYLSLVPTQLTRALDRREIATALARYDAVLLGGAAADASLLSRAAHAGVRVVTTYGMSETCGGCVYDGRPLNGVDVELDGDGRVGLGGPMTFAGYRLDPAATAATLVAGRVLTRDRARWDGDRLTVLGRLDDVVVSGGMNVDLAAVERAVRAVADGEAAVVGVPHPEWGTEVVAVTESDAARLDGLRATLAGTLPAYALPRRLAVVAPLPRTAGGKIDRRRLVADLSPQPESR